MKYAPLAVYACALAISLTSIISYPADCMAARMAKNFNSSREKARVDPDVGQPPPVPKQSREYAAPLPGTVPTRQAPPAPVPAPAPSPMQAAPQTPAPPPPALAPEEMVFPERLTEELHQKFLAEDEDYALAEALLNLTWKRLQGALEKNRYKEVLQAQRNWVARERDHAARQNGQGLPPARAYAAENLRRANILAQHISRPPATGEYESPEAFLSLQNTGGKIQIAGDAGNASGNTCSFEGAGVSVPGWIRMRHDGFPDFMLLSTGNELLIHYASSGSAQGCGLGVDFKGTYVNKR